MFSPLSNEVNSSLKTKFDEAVQKANSLPDQEPDVLLEMYGLYKQALFGDVTGKRPGRMNVKARYKYDAWASREGMSNDEAMQSYIDLITRLVNE